MIVSYLNLCTSEKYILTVVSVKFSSKRRLPFSSKYLRTYILYNINSGNIKTCLINKHPHNICKNKENLPEGADILEKDFADPSIDIIDTGDYLNITPDDDLVKFVQNKKGSEDKNNRNYIKKGKILNIHLDHLITLLKKNDKLKLKLKMSQ